MINDIADLNLSQEDSLEVISSKLKEKLEIDLDTITQALSSFVRDNSNELANDFVNIIPYGDYGNILEDNEFMSNFLKEEASKIDNWTLYSISQSDVNPELIQFIFSNKSVDDGDVFEGHVFLSKHGKIKHVFTQVN